MKELKYIAKATKKAKGESYALEKEKLNSYYGFNFEKERKKAFLLPQWARYEILQFLIKLDDGNDAYYMDTDSIKVGNFEKYKKIFEDYNKKQEETLHVKFKTLGAKRDGKI